MLRRPPPDSLWADPDWMRYWLSRIVSYAGGTITYVAAPILVYSISGSPLLTGITAATEGLPYLLFGLVAGALADRMDRRRVMVGADVVNALVLVTVPVAAALGRLTAAHVIVVGLITMTVFVFWDAANFGAVPTLVGKERIREATNAVWGTTQVFDVVLPGLVGVLVAWVAPSTLYWVNAFTFLRKESFKRSEFKEVIQRILVSAPTTDEVNASFPDWKSDSVSQKVITPKALIVDDDAGWRSILEDLLGESEFQPVTCASFGEALGLLRKDKFSLSVVDLSLRCGQSLDGF